jgi:hypothetical protein
MNKKTIPVLMNPGKNKPGVFLKEERVIRGDNCKIKESGVAVCYEAEPRNENKWSKR